MASTSLNISKLTDAGLIACIEDPRNALKTFRDEAVSELKKRALSEDAIKTLSIPVNEAIAYRIISHEPVADDAVAMHESTFLSAEELREIYLAQLEKYMQYRDQFRYDVWAHLIDPQ